MNIKLGHKAGSGSQRKPVTAPDSASSKSYARIVYGINDGHMVGFIDGLKSLILDNTPVQSSSGEMNITEVEVQTRWGTNDQDYLEGFPSVVNEIGYSNVEIVSDHNFVHYVNDLNTNAVGIRFTWGKIFRQDESNGDISGYRIDYAIDIQTDGNGFVEVLRTALNDKTSSGYERYHRLELPPAEVGWEIRVRRLTPNATSDFIGDKMFLSAVAEIVDAKLRYPNTALIALKFDADKFGSIPKADFRLRGKIIKVPTNYDPETRTYAVVGEGTTNGIWDGSFKLAYTNNPVWIFYDLLLSKRYGLGERLDASMVDKWALYSIGQYCDVMVPDGMGGTEPRLTCNVYINSKYEAFDLLMQLASTFRGILHWDGASIVATADRPSDPVFTFTRANIIGEFNYSGTRARDRSSMISVAFDDPANNYKTDKEVVSDTNAIAEVGVRLKELTAFGCTSRGQAQRIGRLGLLKEQQELRMVTFTVGLDGYIPVTGKIIEIADPLLAGRAIGGRISVVSTDGLVITLDREVTANVGDVLVANGDDGIQQRRDITQVNGNVVTVSAAFTGVSAENVWAIDSEDLSLMRFRVLSVAQNRSDDGLITFTISGVQHNPSIDEGADFSAYIEQPTYSNIEIYTQVAPTELVIGSENVINQGLDITNVVFSWPQAVNAVKYELEWRRDNGSWIKAPIIYSNTFVVENVYHGLYEARIVAINAMDVRSLYTLAQPTIINSKFAEPPMLAFIQATGIQFGAEISWVFPARESQNAEYVEVQISYREDKTDAKLLGNYAYPLNRAEINGLQANLKLWVKARIIDRNKVEGPWTVWVTATTDAEASILLDALSGMITSSQLDQDLTTDIATGVAADAKAVAAKLAADAAAQAASAAQTAASNAGTAAATAQTTANSAQTAASTAQTAANNAATAASNAQTTANTAKSTADQAKADLTALTTSTNATATELRDRLTTTENGLTQEKLDRASGDDAVVGQLNTYKSSNDAALAAVQQKAEAATTASTSNSQAITNLTTTVNTKNRTYRQTTAPTTNRVVGDLWVNTTAGKNNEVRRWNGTAWDDLTDPRTAANATALSSLQSTVTAVDGRATANSNSITQLNADLTTLSNTVDTKAEASAVDSLAARVTTAEGSITSQGSRVTSLENSVNHATTGLASKASSTALTTLNNKVTAIDGRVTSNSSSITTLNNSLTTTNTNVATAQTAAQNAMTAAGQKGKVIFGSTAPVAADQLSQNLWIDTTGNANTPKRWNGSAWVVVTDKVATDALAAANAASSLAATKADSSALTALDSKVTNVDGKVTTNSNSITSLNSRMSAAEGSISTKANATALNDYYTKTEADTKATTIAAGEVSKFSASLGGSLQDNLVIGGNTSTTKTGGYLMASYALSKNLQSTGKKITIRAKVTFDSGGATGAHIRTYIGGGTLVAAKDYIYPCVETVYEMTTTTINRADADKINFYCFPATQTLPTLTVHWVEVYEGESKLLAAVDANSTAIQTTNTEVTRINGVVVAQGTSITNLQAGLTTANNNIATKADGSALTALTTRVTNAEGVNTSQGTAITNLENTVNNATTGLASKASASALTTLNNQVQHSTTGLSAVNTKVDNLKATVENTTNGLASKASSSALDTLSNKVNHSTTGLDAIASKTTVLETDVAKALDVVTIKDTRSTNQPPSWYWTNYAKRTVNEFKTQTVIGVNGFFGGTYCNLETNIPYSDSSGWHIVQTATSSADPSMYVQRVSTSTTAWGAWAQPIKDLRDGLAGKASASAVESLTTRVSTAEGTISSEASKLSTLSTTVGGHTSSISTQQTSINGLNAKATIQVAAGNTIGGIALGNDGGNVEFIVRSNVFAVAPPVGTSGSNKYMMTYRSTAVTLPNGTVVPAGLYLDNLIVDYIDASKIYATSLSAISANLGTIKVGSANIADLAVNAAHITDAAITSAKIGDLQVDTLKIKDNAVTIAIGGKGVQSLSTYSYGGKMRVDIGIQSPPRSLSYSAATMYLRVKRNGTIIDTIAFPSNIEVSGRVNFNYICSLPPIIETVGVGNVTYAVEVTDWNGNWTLPSSNGAWTTTSMISIVITEMKK